MGMYAPGYSWPSVGQWLANGWPMAGQWLANGWPMVGQWLANGWPMVGQWLANGWPIPHLPGGLAGVQAWPCGPPRARRPEIILGGMQPPDHSPTIVQPLP